VIGRFQGVAGAPGQDHIDVVVRLNVATRGIFARDLNGNRAEAGLQHRCHKSMAVRLHN